MTATKTFQLDIWKGDWGLPSIDRECLLVLAYAKFSNLPLIENPISNPFKTPNGRLPVLRSDSNIFDTVKDIIEFFRTTNYNPDYTLNQKQCADVFAYDALLQEKLYPAMQFMWWIDQRNLDELVRPWYSKALPFPFKFYYPYKYEWRAKAMMESLYPITDNIAVIEHMVYSEAQKCLKLLSIRLGETSEYFFGSQPTILDAIIYSYLAPLFKMPLPNPVLQNHLKSYENLAAFVSRISQRYFKNVVDEYEKLKSKENEIKRNLDSDYPHKKRDQVLIGLFVVSVMTSYALWNGIIQVPKQNIESDEYDVYNEEYNEYIEEN